MVLEEFSYCRIENSINDNRVIFSTILFIIFKKTEHQMKGFKKSILTYNNIKKSNSS